MLKAQLAIFVALAAAQADKASGSASTSSDAAQATQFTSHTTSHVKGAAFDRFVTIWLENTDFDKAAGDPNLAWLATQGITLQNYFAVTHPSQPNYVASVGGENWGIDNDDLTCIDANVSTVIDLLEDKHISWGTYQEDMPYTGFQRMAWNNPQTKRADYVRRHNPLINYNANISGRRLSYQKNLTMFYKDLHQQSLPQWMFITPNVTSDGHDTSVTVAGSWTRSFLEPLLSDTYFMNNTLILVTFDENHILSASNRVLGILLGGVVLPHMRGTNDPKYYNHYSEISTVEANWNLHTLGRWDVGANVFDLVAKKTNDIYRPNDAATSDTPTRFQNSSFAGPFNTGFQSAPYPAPNISITSPGTNRTVLPSIIKAWSHVCNSTDVKDDCVPKSYYTDSVVIPDGQHPPEGYAVNNVDN